MQKLKPEMSNNVQNVHFTELESYRWEQFTHMKDAGLTDFDIALKWHLKSTKQVQRLKTKAKRIGNYKRWMDERLAWITEEFPELHATIKKKYPKLAYLVMARLYAKGIPQRVEMESTEDINIKEIRIVAPWKNKNTESLQPQATTTDPTMADKPNSIRIPVDSES